MACCSDDTSINTSAGGIMNTLKYFICGWLARIQSIFGKDKRFNGESRKSFNSAPHDLMPTTLTFNRSMTLALSSSHSLKSISTPHHVPFHEGGNISDFKVSQKKSGSASRWNLFGLFGTTNAATGKISDDIELQSIATTEVGKSATITTTTTTFSKSKTQDTNAGNLNQTKNGNVSINPPLTRPAELWKKDQAQMLNGKYHFDPNFQIKYKLKQLIGEGSFGFVWVAERLRDHKEVAVKFILREKVPAGNWIFNAELGLVPLEVHIMKMITHKNIIQFLDYFSDIRFVYLVTELYGTSWTWPNPLINATRNVGLRTPGQLLQLSSLGSKETIGIPGLTRRSPCDLFECIEAHSRLPTKTIRNIFGQLLDAVYYLYSMGIVHRDLKDENIVLDEDYNIKLIDFGSASFIPLIKAKLPSSSPLVPSAVETPDPRHQTYSFGADEGYFEKFNGTVAFAAPEIIRGLRYKPSEAEVWSLGVLLYTMVFKKSPFPSSDAILHTQLSVPYEETAGVYDLLGRMLQKNPLDRIRLEDIVSHPFLAIDQD